MKVCTFDGCVKSIKARGLCSMHYARWSTHGTRDGGPMVHDKPAMQCGADGCSKSARVRGIRGDSRVAPGKALCPMHYQRIRTGWEPKRQARRIPRGHYKDGYIFLTVDGRSVPQHRLVMQEKIGRKLRNDETVHHINGVRDDNRPENLELWSSSQPAGQRALDKLEWAYEIVKRYAHLEEV